MVRVPTDPTQASDGIRDLQWEPVEKQEVTGAGQDTIPKIE